MIDIDELERLERSATPRLWCLDERYVTGRIISIAQGQGVERVVAETADLSGPGLARPGDDEGRDWPYLQGTADDAVFIAAFRNAAAELISELRSSRARIAELDAEIERCKARERKLRSALIDAAGWMDDDGGDCGSSLPQSCALCNARALLLESEEEP